MDIPIFETDNSISAKAFRDGYELGKSNVKSSLKRDIEKQLKLIEASSQLEPEEKLFVIAGFLKSLELIETVEP